MRYTKEEDTGLINNFAVEPKMYRAEPASQTQKTQTLVLVVGGLALVAGLVVVAVSLS
jgi:hypothetical protein